MAFRKSIGVNRDRQSIYDAVANPSWWQRQAGNGKITRARLLRDFVERPWARMNKH
jgi:hypothetical protein